MTSARVVRFHQTGGPEELKIDTIDVRAPEAGEVRIRSHALGLNRAEILYRAGAYVQEPSYPAQIGYEAAGEIESVGPGVAGFKPGDPVNVLPISPLNHYAVHGELVLAPAHAVVRQPKGLTYEEGAATWMQYLTAYGALIGIAGVGEGDFVIIPAASSSVGLAAIQLVNRAGGTPIALTRTVSKVKQLRSAGAKYVVATEAEDTVGRIMAITRGRGARVTFDPVGGESFPILTEAAAMNGLIFIYGALGSGTTPLPIFPVLSKHLTIRGYDIFELAADPDRLALAVSDITAGLADGTLTPVIDRVFPFESFSEAHRYLESNRQFGKIIVKV